MEHECDICEDRGVVEMLDWDTSLGDYIPGGEFMKCVCQTEVREPELV